MSPLRCILLFLAVLDTASLAMAFTDNTWTFAFKVGGLAFVFFMLVYDSVDRIAAAIATRNGGK